MGWKEEMRKGRPVVGEGMSVGDQTAPTNWCEYTGLLSLAAAPDDGAAHDLYASFEAGGNASYVLDYFVLSAAV